MRHVVVIMSAEEFVALRTSDDREQYTRAARDFAPDEVWLEVIEKYPDMKADVAQNKSVPHSILKILADDPDPAVRWWVAAKRKTDPAILAKLAKDANESVRHRVACNVKTPTWLLQELVNDEWDFVAEGARNQIAERMG